MRQGPGRVDWERLGATKNTLWPRRGRGFKVWHPEEMRNAKARNFGKQREAVEFRRWLDEAMEQAGVASRKEG